jgi:hypothetical protein
MENTNDYSPSLKDLYDLKSHVDLFIAIARIDNMYAGRARVMFVMQKSLIDFCFTDNIWMSHNFYTVDNAQDFLDNRLKTAIAKRNKLVTAFRIVELHISIIRVFE